MKTFIVQIDLTGEEGEIYPVERDIAVALRNWYTNRPGVIDVSVYVGERGERGHEAAFAHRPWQTSEKSMLEDLD